MVSKLYRLTRNDKFDKSKQYYLNDYQRIVDYKANKSFIKKFYSVCRRLKQNKSCQ